MSKITVCGFAGSAYVRTVRMVLAEKGETDYEHVPVNVLKGEPKQPEHLERHPFGKVPVVDIDGCRIIETPAIARYPDTVLPGKDEDRGARQLQVDRALAAVIPGPAKREPGTGAFQRLV